jgi:hypothetical protein
MALYPGVFARKHRIATNSAKARPRYLRAGEAHAEAARPPPNRDQKAIYNRIISPIQDNGITDALRHR